MRWSGLPSVHKSLGVRCTVRYAPIGGRNRTYSRQVTVCTVYGAVRLRTVGLNGFAVGHDRCWGRRAVSSSSAGQEVLASISNGDPR